MKKKFAILVVMIMLVLVASLMVALASQSQNSSATGSSSAMSTSAQAEKGILSTLGKDIDNTQGNELLTDEAKIRTIVTDVFLAMNNCEEADITFELPSVFNQSSENAKKSYEYRKKQNKVYKRIEETR